MKKRLSASTLKTIALITMFIDHFGMTVAYEYEQGAFVITNTLRIIGATAFVLYAFLLTEGFVHTSDRKKYALRLAAFAAVSEIPYDLANEYQLFNPWGQNIFFTLLIGFIVIWIIDGLRQRKDWTGTCLSTLTIIGGMLLAEILRTDFGLMGVALITVFYLLRENRFMPIGAFTVFFIGHILNDYIYALIGYFKTFISMPGMEKNALQNAADMFRSTFLTNSVTYCNYTLVHCVPGAVLALILICLYNGIKGRQFPKAFYYLFYPAHLLLLYFVVRIVFL